mgnify:CR=1 FL=1
MEHAGRDGCYIWSVQQGAGSDSDWRQLARGQVAANSILGHHMQRDFRILRQLLGWRGQGSASASAIVRPLLRRCLCYMRRDHRLLVS